MGCRACRHPTADPAAIQHDDGTPAAGKLIDDGQPGNSRTGDGFWARASIWLIGAAIAMALVAALAGFTDFFGEPRIRALSDAWYHLVGNLTAVIVAVINFALRYSQGAETAIRPWGVVLSF